MIVHLVDGTYELFRHFYGRRRGGTATASASAPWSACCTRCSSCSRAARRTSASRPTTSSSRSATTSGPATRRAPASTRRCARSSRRSRTRSTAMGVTVWPMVELEADDALAAAARIADEDDARRAGAASGRRTRTSRSACAATASCRSTGAHRPIRDDAGVREKFGVAARVDPRPARARRRLRRRLSRASRASARSAPRGCCHQHGPIEAFPPEVARRAAASSRCCSRISRRCAPAPSSSRTPTSCAGAGRRPMGSR